MAGVNIEEGVHAVMGYEIATGSVRQTARRANT